MKNTKNLTYAALTAGLYVILTLIASMMGLSNGVIQIRFSESLTILPVFTSSAIPGLTLGCVIANIISGAHIYDVIFGSVATLIGAVFTYVLRKNKYLAASCPIISNTVIIPLILSYVYHFEGSIWYFAVTVFIGEVISCGVLGLWLHRFIKKHNIL
ncbi:MAG: QueT transporter family protein [Ruminococcaceae bacterium]|nr:QueT transporter family protein [Oscillospiraceae bacterium]